MFHDEKRKGCINIALLVMNDSAIIICACGIDSTADCFGVNGAIDILFHWVLASFHLLYLLYHGSMLLSTPFLRFPFELSCSQSARSSLYSPYHAATIKKIRDRISSMFINSFSFNIYIVAYERPYVKRKFARPGAYGGSYQAAIAAASHVSIALLSFLHRILRPPPFLELSRSTVQNARTKLSNSSRFIK